MDNQNKVKLGGMSKKAKILALVILAVIIIVALAFVSQMNKQKVQTNNNPAQNTDVQSDATNTPAEEASTPSDSKDLTPVVVPNVKDAKVAVVGANPITPDNKVITPTGEVTDNQVLPMSNTAPKQTGFLAESDLSAGVLKLTVGNNKFTPSQFTTKAGAPTTFAITGVDEFSHVIAFNDPLMAAIAVLVGPGQTKAITFNAPTTPGTYTFYCASPGHADKGEKGQMIVK